MLQNPKKCSPQCYTWRRVVKYRDTAMKAEDENGLMYRVKWYNYYLVYVSKIRGNMEIKVLGVDIAFLFGCPNYFIKTRHFSVTLALSLCYHFWFLLHWFNQVSSQFVGAKMATNVSDSPSVSLPNTVPKEWARNMVDYLLGPTRITCSSLSW